MKRLLLLVVFILYNPIGCTEVTDLEYELKPPIFYLDNFDRCMVYGDDALYCDVMMQLEPKDARNRSSAWKTIEKLIEDPSNYRHDHLRYGVCVTETCPKIPKSKYAIGNGTIKLVKAIINCYNKKFNKYELKANIMHMHCENNKSFYKVDTLDIIVLFCFIGYIILIAAGTIYWEYSNDSKKLLNHNTLHNILCSVAIQKHWAALIKKPTTQHLASIEGLRVTMMLIVLSGHTFMIIFASPIINTAAHELITKRFIFTFVSNGALTIHTNFIIAGLLLSLSMLMMYENSNDIYFVDVIKGFIKRCIRIVPMLLICILFHMTWLRHISRGPNWYKVVGYEQINCRKTWWTNILFINNYYDPANMCFPHSWYIACDTQLFLLSLIVMYFAIKFKKYQFHILIFAAVMGYFIPFLVHYVGEYDITVRMSPEASYRFMIHLKEWQKLSIPAESNMGAYLQGLLFGYIYYKHKNYTFKINKIVALICSILLGTFFFGIIYAIFPFYHGAQYSRIGAALYHTFSRNLIAMTIGVVILATAMAEHCPLKKLLEFPLFQIMGKLSYCVYIFHTDHLRIVYGKLRQPLIIHADTLIPRVAGDILISYLIALMACVVFEGPINALMQLLMNPKPKINDKNGLKKNN